MLAPLGLKGNGNDRCADYDRFEWMDKLIATTGLPGWEMSHPSCLCPISIKKIPQLKPDLVHNGEVKRQGKVQVILLLWPSSWSSVLIIDRFNFFIFLVLIVSSIKNVDGYVSQITQFQALPTTVNNIIFSYKSWPPFTAVHIIIFVFIQKWLVKVSKSRSNIYLFPWIILHSAKSGHSLNNSKVMEKDSSWQGHHV